MRIGKYILFGLLGVSLSLAGCSRTDHINRLEQEVSPPPRVRIIQSKDMTPVNYSCPINDINKAPEELKKKATELKDASPERVLEENHNPLEAQLFTSTNLKPGRTNFDLEKYGVKDYWPSFLELIKSRIDDCDGGGIGIMCMLHDDGFPPYLLHLYNNGKDPKPKQISHLVFVYKTENGKFGTAGMNKDDFIFGVSSFGDFERIFSERYQKRCNMTRIYDFAEFFPEILTKEGNYCPPEFRASPKKPHNK